jgi:outer membrane protein
MQRSRKLHPRRRLRQLPCAVLLVLATVCGCAVDEKKEIAAYRSILDADAANLTFTPGEPLSLDTALLLANQHNEQIAISGENYLQALIEKDRTAASFLPSVALIPSFSFADDGDDRRNNQSGSSIGDPSDPNDSFGGGSGGSRNNSTGDSNLDVPVNLRMNLFNGFRDVANRRRAGSEIERQHSLMLDMQAVVLLDVARAYYQVLRAEQSVRVLENSVTLQNERVRDMRTRNRAGVARPLDVAQTEAQASATRASLISAQADVQNGRTVLAFLIGQEVGESPLIDDLSLPGQLPTLDASLSDARQSRQDLLAAQSAVEAARSEVDVAFGQYYPSVNLNFNYYLERQSDPEDSMYNGLISANLPIFTGGVIHQNVRHALSRLRQASLDESYTRRQVEQDVKLAYTNVAAAGDRRTELQISRDAAQEALRQAEGNYNAGRATNLERLIAQSQVLSAELDLATATYEQKLQYLNLQRVLGRIAEAIQANPTSEPATQPVASTR